MRSLIHQGFNSPRDELKASLSERACTGLTLGRLLQVDTFRVGMNAVEIPFTQLYTLRLRGHANKPNVFTAGLKTALLIKSVARS